MRELLPVISKVFGTILVMRDDVSMLKFFVAILVVRSDEMNITLKSVVLSFHFTRFISLLLNFII